MRWTSLHGSHGRGAESCGFSRLRGSGERVSALPTGSAAEQTRVGRPTRARRGRGERTEAPGDQGRRARARHAEGNEADRGEAERLDCAAIVMGADRPRNRFVADFMWSQEPYRVRRRAGRPVTSLRRAMCRSFTSAEYHSLHRDSGRRSRSRGAISRRDHLDGGVLARPRGGARLGRAPALGCQCGPRLLRLSPRRRRRASRPLCGLGAVQGAGRPISLDRGQGLAWWALDRREPAFIPENALDDPRFHYVPELEEEKFQSLVSVPLLSRDEKRSASSACTPRHPREITQGEADFLASSAALVSGAIENARLYEQMGDRVRELEHLTELGEEVAAAETPRRARPADRTPGTRSARCVSRAPLPRGAGRRAAVPALVRAARCRRSAGARISELGSELGRRGRRARVSVSLVAGGELLGALVAHGTRKLDLARTVANQVAVA